MLKPTLAALLVSATAHAECVQRVDDYCADSFANLQIQRGQPARLNVLLAHDSAMKVVLPEGAVIDDGSFAIGSGALKHQFDDEQSPSSFLLAARRPKRGSAVGQKTNIIFEIAGQTVILNVKVTAERGTEQITLTFPELTAQRDREAALRRTIRAEVEAELSKARANIGQTSRTLAEDQIIDAALQRLTCSIEEERGFDRFLILTTRRICAFGGWIFVEVVLENARRKDFELRDVAVAGVWDGAPRGVDFKIRWVTRAAPPKRVAHPLKLRFDEAARGMILITPPEGELPDAWRITVAERGGLKRSVTADDIEF